MRLHATRKNLAPSALDHQPVTNALDSSHSLPFIAPLRPRWSPVVLQRKMPSISFFFMPLRDSFFHNDRGTPTPLVPVRCKPTWFGMLVPFTPIFEGSGVKGHSFPLSLSFATHLYPELSEGRTHIPLTSVFATLAKGTPVTPFLATLPQTNDLKSRICHTSKNRRGWGSLLLTRLVAQASACVTVEGAFQIVREGGMR